MKTCPRCKVEKESVEFHKQKVTKDGLYFCCKMCVKIANIAWKKANPEKAKANRTAWAKANPEKAKVSKVAWTKANPEKMKDNSAAWTKANPGKKNATTRKRQAAKLYRTPPWLTKKHYKEMQQFYTDARELSWLSEGGLVVDHIVPLQGKNVSGLHVPWNLQILPSSLNSSKGNKFNG